MGWLELLSNYFGFVGGCVLVWRDETAALRATQRCRSVNEHRYSVLVVPVGHKDHVQHAAGETVPAGLAAGRLVDPGPSHHWHADGCPHAVP